MARACLSVDSTARPRSLSLADRGKAAENPVPLAGLAIPRPRNKAAAAKLSETAEAEPNNKPGQATAVKVPGVATGVLAGGSDADLFRFTSKKDESWVIQTRARRDKSPADTRIEILHKDGRPVLRFIAEGRPRTRPSTFRPIDSRSNQARLENWEEMGLNQFRLHERPRWSRTSGMPQGPDSAMQFLHHQRPAAVLLRHQCNRPRARYPGLRC
ncbi:MAG: hypothetical protein Ct9H300mP1_19580 [Planctomycetaceae bacterium]|nr:MAG: hypothetical protein Ct9H300mP1_19580 [Planctomycetaceae bacterium]